MFLLDSNVYIAGFNDPAFGEAFRAFHQRNLPRLILSAVVAHELLVGARDRHRIDARTRLTKSFGGGRSGMLRLDGCG